MKEIIINKNKEVETVCLVENGILLEKYINNEETRKNRLEGNIYAAKIADIIPGMQAAFVDYGDTKKGFLHFKDAIPKIDHKSEENNEVLEGNINKILKPGQRILIQIKKDCNEKKGAKVSTHISLPSKYIAYMPDTNIITISHKIEDEKRKEELLELAKKHISKGNGVIIRTSAEHASNEEIIKDMERCSKKWERIKNKYDENDSFQLICHSESIQERMILDLDIDKITTNSKEEFERIKTVLQLDQVKKVKLEYKVKDDLLDLYGLNNQICKSEERKIWLDCGGFITIDKTEALTAIDVNTGKYIGNKDLESTVFKVNKEATIEIVKQIRLRDIGGIIIIDYIDMCNEENKAIIEDELKKQLKKDRAKTQVEGFTKLNLMEMTRKHICSHLDE